MKKIAVALISSFVALYFISCGSTPAAEPAPEAIIEDVVESTVEEVVEQASFAAENAKFLGLVETARESAIAADAKKYYPEGFDAAEAMYTTFKNDVAANPGTDYSEQLKDLAARYQSLASASQAQALKEKALELNLSAEDQTSSAAGDKALEEYAAMGTGAAGKDLLVKANEALEAYNNVVNKGLKANAARERQAALDAKKDADSVKAGVARKDDYAKASDAFKKADSAYVTANIEGAYKGYKTAKEIYVELYESIKEKRAAAQAAIERAKQRVANSASYAEEADTIAPLAEEVAGIEKEDAVLLEEDKFENPDEAVINVEDGTTAKIAEKAAAAAIAADEAVNEVLEAK